MRSERVLHVKVFETTVVLHSWPWPTEPSWERIHIDYAGPFMDTMFLVVVDAHSKVLPMKTSAPSSRDTGYHGGSPVAGSMMQ